MRGVDLGWLTRSPDQIALFVFPPVEISHDTVNNMRLGSEQIDGVDIPIGRPSVFNLLNVWAAVSRIRTCGRGGAGAMVAGHKHTGNVLIQNIILFDDVVDQSATRLVQNKDFPLSTGFSMGGAGGGFGV